MSLKLCEFEIRRNGTPLLPAIDVHVGAGQVLTLMGRSGIGKSTLLSAIAGNLSRDFTVLGDAHLSGVSILSLPMEKRGIGILFQDPLLFPHLSVGENLAFGAPRPKKARPEIDGALQSIGLANFYDRDPATLSGGEASRVALIRALLAEPKALLLDEPFAKLDQALRQDMRALTFGEIQKRQIPAILVTHDEADAKAAKGEILRLT